MISKDLSNFISCFSKLPGIGYKTSERLGWFILSQPYEFAKQLSDSIIILKENSHICSICGNISDSDPCNICNNSSRDRTLLCVVENALDINYIESTNKFYGIYHVLGGVISPLNGVTPEDLKINGLIERVMKMNIKEIIFATSPTTEGDTTILYIKELLTNYDIKLSHLPRGIPVGTGLQYAGIGSLSQALKSREEIKS